MGFGMMSLVRQEDGSRQLEKTNYFPCRLNQFSLFRFHAVRQQRVSASSGIAAYSKAVSLGTGDNFCRSVESCRISRCPCDHTVAASIRVTPSKASVQ